jgi:hypothetical protein
VPVGRPELVGTLPDYRGRGLVRALFDVVHERSAALGHELQVITGIPHFYRQFGYTMAVDLADPHAAFPLHGLADPVPDYQPSFTLRPAAEADIPSINRWYDYMARERLLTEFRSADEWRYEILGRSPASGQKMAYLIIENQAGEGVGYIELFANLPSGDNPSIECNSYVVGDQSSYLETFDNVMRGIKNWAEVRYGYCPPLLMFGAGIHETLDRLIDRTRGGSTHYREYMWYLRVPNPITFFRLIQPVLERRLAGSGANCYSGELKIGFYDLTGISLTFERGQLTCIKPVSGKDGYDAAFPWHLLWNVVFGHHHYDEIRNILPEAWATGKGAVLLDALFPKQKSWLKGLT